MSFIDASTSLIVIWFLILIIMDIKNHRRYK